MSFLSKAATPVVTVSRAVRSFAMRFQRATGSWWDWSGFSNLQYKTQVGDGSGSSVVMAPLNFLARTFPEAPVTVERLDGKKQWECEPDHPMCVLIDNPNPYYHGQLMWRATIVDTVCSGESYWIKIFDSQLRVIELWWTPAALMEPQSPNDGSQFISHYLYRPGGDPVRLEVGQVVHFRPWGLDPKDPRHGWSPLQSVLREVFADDEAGRYAAAILNNMGVPGLIVAPDGDYTVGDNDLIATEQALQAKFTGNNRGKPFVLGAPTKVSQFGFSPQQMDMRTLRRVPEERTSAVLGIPAIVAGLGAGLDRSTFANMAEARQMAYESCIIPLQGMCGADVKTQLLNEFEPDPAKVRVKFDTSEVRVLQEDENAIVTRMLSELTGGAMMLSEYRRERGLDTDPSQDVFLRPFNLTEIRKEDVGLEPEPTPDPLDPSNPASPLHPDHPDNPANAKPPIDPATGKPLENGKAKAWRESQQQLRLKAAFDLQHKLQAEFVRQSGHLEAQLLPKLSSIFDDLGGLAVSAWRATNPAKSPKAYKDAASDAEARKAAVEAEVLATVQHLRFEVTKAQLAKALEQHWAQTSDLTLGAVNGVFGLNLSLPDPVMRSIIQQGGTRAGLIDIEGDTKTALFDSLFEGRSLGEGVDQLAKRIADSVPAGRFQNAGSTYRAKLIARTETKYAQNVSALKAYNEAGAKDALIFDGQSPNSDEECIARDHTTVSLEEAQSMADDEHPNGTLSFAPIFA